MCKMAEEPFANGAMRECFRMVRYSPFTLGLCGARLDARLTLHMHGAVRS